MEEQINKWNAVKGIIFLVILGAFIFYMVNKTAPQQQTEIEEQIPEPEIDVDINISVNISDTVINETLIDLVNSSLINLTNNNT